MENNANRSGRNWTEEELEYMTERWGDISIPSIAKKLNRTTNAVTNKGSRMGLGAVLQSGDYITLNQLVIAVKGNNFGVGYITESWGKKRGLPIHKKKVKEYSFNVVYLDEFWRWAENNRSLIDFSKMEPLILGEEPDWVSEQRKKDFDACSLQKKTPWTADEDDRLKYLLKKQKYGYAELSEILCRSAGAIQRRCIDLGIKERPVKADNHCAGAAWTDLHYKIVADGIKNGDSYSLIGKKIGKSEKAVRGKVYTVYLTENADKIRAMIGNGSWGDGAPEPIVKQAIHLSHCRRECTKQLSLLVGLLKYRRNQLGYEPYWQRFMCMKWDDFEGCAAECDNCDECVEFERIKPQYCARCGATFYEKSKNRFCKDCRIARKKQAQKKWCRINQK